MPAFFFFQNHLPNLPFQQILCKNNCVIPLWQSLCALCWDHWLVSLALPLRCCFQCVSCVKFSEETWGTNIPDKYCRYDLISHSQGYSLYSSCHQQLTRHFKCHVSLPTLLQILSLLSISHYLQDLLFISHFFITPKELQQHKSAGDSPAQGLGASALPFLLVSHLNFAFRLSSCRLSSLIPHFLSTSLWSLCSYFQLAYLILSLPVLQNVSGEILAELFKMQVHNILISCPSFLGPSIFLILALLFASSFSIVILLINLHFFPLSYIKWCLPCFSLMALILLLFSSVSISPAQRLASVVLDK